MGKNKQDARRVEKLGAALAGPRPAGAMLQDYVPACDCIDWQLSRQFWDRRGPEAFLGGDVPYVVTNDGHLAANAVAVLLAACTQARKDGTLEPEINILELGAGSGLFAKQFLDQLRRADAPIAAEVYNRLTYTVTDGAESMIRAMDKRGIFADHKSHVRCLAARAPGIAGALGGDARNGTFRAVFTNYLLDSLPFTILSLSADKLHELRLRTSIAEDVELSQFTDLSEAEVIARFQSGEAVDVRGLTDIYPALVIDARYDPVTRSALPLAATLPDASNGDATGPRPYLHCHGALACIDEVLTLLRPDGFMLISDYGTSGADEESRTLEFQHFGGSVAIGLNFEALDRVFDQPGRSRVIAPDSDSEHLLSRMIARDPAPAAVDAFRTLYGKAAWDRLTKPLLAAQELVGNGQTEAARWKYQEALRLQPDNWAVLEEIAGFLCYHLEDYEAALGMARESLELNHISPGAWNIVGDCFFYTDHLQEAAEAYERAALANPTDVRAMLNLAWVALHGDKLGKALEYIAKGLTFDVTGAFREALLNKQEQVLARQSRKHSNDMMRGMNRIRGHANLPGRLLEEN